MNATTIIIIIIIIIVYHHHYYDEHAKLSIGVLSCTPNYCDKTRCFENKKRTN